MGKAQEIFYENRINKAMPKGIIVLWSGATTDIPDGWAICDGNNGTPDLRDRFVVGAGNNYSVGDTGGADSVTLTTDQIPAHSHTVASHSHSYKIPYSTTSVLSTGTAIISSYTYIASGTASPTTDSVGGGLAHENRPPYYALAYIMKL